MSADRSAAARAELTTQIAQVERREEEFFELRNHQLNSLERFREQFHAVERRRASALDESLRSGNKGAQRELEEQQERGFLVDRYVQESVEELEQASSQVRQSLDDERQRLIRDRDMLPWA